MSKSVATRCSNRTKAHKTSRKRGGEDEEKEAGEEQNEGSAAEITTTLTTTATAPAATDQFMHTPEFRKHFVEFVPGDALMKLRLATKGWNAATDAFIDEGVKSGELIVHGGKDFSDAVSSSVLEEKRKLVTRAIFLLNVTNVRIRACKWAANHVVVDIPEGVKRIGRAAFSICRSLTTVSFLATLTLIGGWAFHCCYSLDNVDLLHTNLQELGDQVFYRCDELKSMTIPESLQTLGHNDFYKYSKLILSSIDVRDFFLMIQHPKSSPIRSKQHAQN